MDHLYLCIALLQTLYPESWNDRIEKKMPDRISTCISVMDLAVEMDAPPNLAAAVAWHESGFNASAVSKAGARGPMQVLPKYWCPNKKLEGCDLLVEGIRALKVYLAKYKDEKEALCHYNAGNKCTKQSRYYARRVLSTKRRLTYIEHHIESIVFE